MRGVLIGFVLGVLLGHYWAKVWDLLKRGVAWLKTKFS